MRQDVITVSSIRVPMPKELRGKPKPITSRFVQSNFRHSLASLKQRGQIDKPMIGIGEDIIELKIPLDGEETSFSEWLKGIQEQRKDIFGAKGKVEQIKQEALNVIHG